MFKEKVNKRSFLWKGIVLSSLLALLMMSSATAQEENTQAPAADQTAQTASDNASAEAVPAESAADQTAEAPAENAEAADQAAPLTPEDVEVTSSAVTVAKQPVQDDANLGSAVVFGSVIAVFLLSLFLAHYFSKAWRLYDYKGRYFAVLFCFLIALVSTITGFLGHRFNLGIDLSGGSVLVYGVQQRTDAASDEGNVDDANSAQGLDSQTMDDLKRVLAQRINQGGVREISIQEMGGNNEIKITIPEADEAEVSRIERKVNEAGQLKFRILASSQSTEERELVETAQRPEFSKFHEIKLPEPIGKDGIITGGTWVPIDPTQLSDISRMSGVITREAPDQPEAQNAENAQKIYEILVLELDELYTVSGQYMARVDRSVNERGEPILRFDMRTDGAERMKRLTDRYKAGSERASGRQLGIILNDSLYSAPSIQDTIGSSGTISFGHDLNADSIKRINQDVDDLLQVMKSGVLPAQLTEAPLTRMLTGPTLGEDTIRKGENSVIWGGLLVLAFMIAYYGFAGVVASFAVLMNLLLIMMIMLGLRAAFTLSGLAGLVLTVGMAVDANVLIFERIKEELNGGATLKMAIRNGFDRAFTAIFDSNITTMLTALILYAVGSEQIKGFAVTLFLGVLFSLFTATYVSRIIFETAEHLGMITKRCVYPILPGLKPFGKTNVAFMNYRKTFMTISVIVILVGLLGVLARGKGIFDIDFVGGVEIQAIFKQPQEIGHIRSELNELPDLSVSSLALSKDRNGNPVQENCCFTISTSCKPGMESEEYRKEVEGILKDSFGDALVQRSFQAANLRTEDVPVAGSTTGETKKAVIADLTMDPPVAQEVVKGYFDDEMKTFLEEKGIEDLNFTVTADDLNVQNQEQPRAAWKIVFDTEDQALSGELVDRIVKDVDGSALFESSQTIGSSVAGYARTQGILAIIFSLICIIAYIGLRFKRVVFGFAATVALAHDVLITLGLLALSKWLAPILGFAGISEFKIGLSTVAAFLTIIGYSLNDTIVLFDRMREICGKNTEISLDIINKAINQTLSRTILTSLTTLFVAVVLYFFGGGGIHTFSFAMCVGVVVGTYSSLFIATPVLYWMLNLKKNK